jgi:DNA-binding Lrp family transcriptional regulator
MESGIILGYGITVDLSKFGYRLYHVNINLKKLTKRFDIIDYIKSNPHFYYIEKALGDAADLELEFYLENVEQLHQIMEDISLKFPESIKNFKYFSYLKRHKYNLMPHIDKKDPYYSFSKTPKGYQVIVSLD